MRRRVSVRVAVVAAVVACFLGVATAGWGADWPAYLFGASHSSTNAAATAITPQNASSLVKAWTWRPDPPTMTGQPGRSIAASPTVYNGRIFISSNTGVFYALDEQTGTVIWKRFLGFVPKKTLGARGISSTAAVAPDPVTGVPTVYVYSPDGYLYAMKASDGSVVWKSLVVLPSKTVSDYYAWSSPTVINGRIYVGITSQGDEPLVKNAGEVAYDQATGTKIAQYFTLAPGVKGGSIWSSAASDGQSVWVTTGNPPPPQTGNDDGNSIVRLDAATMAREDGWKVPASELIPDSDFGGSPTLFQATIGGTPTQMVGACNKNGIYYAWRQQDLASGPVWMLQEGAPDNVGPGLCIAAAAWDGSRLFLAGDGTTIGGTAYEGSVRQVDPATGTPIWETGLPGTILGSPTLSGGGVIAAAAFDTNGGTNALWLLDASTGQILKQVSTKNSQEWGQPVFADNYLLVPTWSHGLMAYRPGPSPRTATPVGAAGSPSSSVPTTCSSAWSLATGVDEAPLDGLFGIAPLSAADAWAVGDHFSTSTGSYRTLTEHWNGTKWKLVTSANASSGNNFLNDAATVSATDAWAVGSQVNSSQTTVTLTEHWNGVSWSVIASPNVGENSYLTAVAATASNDVWAVGYSYASGAASTLVEHWNGTSWSVVSSPNPGTQANILNDVTVSPTGDLWAVGYQATAGTSTPLILRYNGTSWSTVASPAAGAASYLEGVGAAPGGNAWGVGYKVSSTGVETTLVEHWDGTSWTIIPSSSPSATLNVLLGVATATDTDVWAVGYAHQAGADQTLAEHWDGSNWTVAPSPDAGGTADYLTSIARDPAGRFWSPGYATTTGSGAKTLIGQLCP
jgi:outer membrane protein assembly factor BamB